MATVAIAIQREPKGHKDGRGSDRQPANGGGELAGGGHELAGLMPQSDEWTGQRQHSDGGAVSVCELDEKGDAISRREFSNGGRGRSQISLRMCQTLDCQTNRTLTAFTFLFGTQRCSLVTSRSPELFSRLSRPTPEQQQSTAKPSALDTTHSDDDCHHDDHDIKLDDHPLDYVYGSSHPRIHRHFPERPCLARSFSVAVRTVAPQLINVSFRLTPHSDSYTTCSGCYSRNHDDNAAILLLDLPRTTRLWQPLPLITNKNMASLTTPTFSTLCLSSLLP